MSHEYHFGVPGIAVWILHILLGAFFIYTGLLINSGKPLPNYYSNILTAVGINMMLYHGHIWIFGGHSEKPSN